MSEAPQQFLRDLDKSRVERDRLPEAARRESAAALFNQWPVADRLRANLVGEPLQKKMARLVAELSGHFAESAKLE